MKFDTVTHHYQVHITLSKVIG